MSILQYLTRRLYSVSKNPSVLWWHTLYPCFTWLRRDEYYNISLIWLYTRRFLFSYQYTFLLKHVLTLRYSWFNSATLELLTTTDTRDLSINSEANSRCTIFIVYINLVLSCWVMVVRKILSLLLTRVGTAPFLSPYYERHNIPQYI